MQKPVASMVRGLGTLAGVTAIDVAVNITAQCWPIKIPRHELEGLYTSLVACSRGVVARAQNLTAEFLVVGNKNRPFETEKAVLPCVSLEPTANVCRCCLRVAFKERQYWPKLEVLSQACLYLSKDTRVGPHRLKSFQVS